jgi:hypothetical protein
MPGVRLLVEWFDKGSSYIETSGKPRAIRIVYPPPGQNGRQIFCHMNPISSRTSVVAAAANRPSRMTNDLILPIRFHLCDEISLYVESDSPPTTHKEK